MINPQRVRFKAIAFTVFCLIFLSSARAAYSATYNVSNGDVAGLIASINSANSSPGPNTINLASGGTYTLTAIDNGVNGLPAITNSMTINGNGATIQRSSAAGTPDFRFFLVLTNGAVTFSGLTLTNGTGTGPASDNVLGGAISNRNSGTVNVIGCVIFGNSANYGGGIENVDGTLNVSNSTISGNSIRPSTDDPCVTCGGTGGGIHNGQGTVNITNSTISGNSARGGGGMISFGGTVNIANSTIAGNTVADVGGGLNHFGGMMNVTNSTIAGNTAANAGGIQEVDGATLILHNTIIALNTASNGKNDLTGTVTSQGHNIIGNLTGASIAAQAGDQFGVTAAQLQFGALSNNGGATQTIPLLCGSVAINTGDDVVLGSPLSLNTDQRGVARRVGSHVDVGAFEANTCNPGDAQSAIFFATKDNATEYDVFRYKVGPNTSAVLQATFTESNFKYPIGLALSPFGELFVVNQGMQGGFVGRLLNPTGNGLFNGNIPAGSEATFYGAFRGNELFVVQQFSGVRRFIINPDGSFTSNGQLPITPTIGELRGVVVTPWGELFVSEANLNAAIIHRFVFDANGNAQANGTFSDSHLQSTHGMAFSPWGELFATSPTNHSVVRFTFDAARNASYNGSITGGGLDSPLDLSFAPWGELFVGNQMTLPTPNSPGSYQGISRFTFNAAHVAASNGTVTTPLPISGIKFEHVAIPTPTPTSSMGTLFGVPEFANTPQANTGEIYRFQVTPTGTPVQDATITDTSLYSPVGVAFSSNGEMFVTNRGPRGGPGGSITRFLDPTGTPISNGVISSADFYAPHWAAFRGNELFAAEGDSNSVLRFVINADGSVSQNGVITDGLVNTLPRGVAVSPWGEVFVSQPGVGISRYLIANDGHAVYNGDITSNGFSSTHGITFDRHGDLFVANPGNNSITRVIFDPGTHAVLSTIQITSGQLSTPIAVTFSPWGELFVCNYSSPTVMRFVFDNSSNAIPNGTFSVPRPLANIAFVPGNDSTSPLTTAVSSIAPNASGWNNSDVTISLSASDEDGGSGVKDITYSASGAQSIPSTIVTGVAAAVNITVEGQTTLSFFARDNAGNIEATKTLTIKLDKHAPSVSCGSADGAWHASDVSIPCTANDAISGLANSSDASFALSTNVASGTETANASTDSRTVCDLAGNCNPAGPSTGNKVDKKAPTISCPAPTSAPADSSCQAAIPSVVSAVTASDVGSGSLMVTQSPTAGTMVGPGPHTITVTATDGVNNPSNCSTTFTVQDVTAPVVPNLPGSPQSFNWIQANTPGSTPGPRFGHGMVYDPARSKVILFGGQNAQGVINNEVWELDSASNTWTNVTPTTGSMPSPRFYFGMAYDMSSSRVVVYGGQVSNLGPGIASDTWEWDPATRTWIAKPNGSLPNGPRLGSGMAYDPNLHQIILFGGRNFSSFGSTLTETYAWDGNTWHQLNTPVGPIGRYTHGMATDFARSKVVMFGGYNGNLLGDTWEWNGSVWTLVAPNGSGPFMRGGHGLAYDSDRQRTVLFGGSTGQPAADTWEWNGANWTQLAPQAHPSVRSSAMVYDTAQSKLVIFSGDALVQLTDTWYSETTSGLPDITGECSVSVTAPTAMDSCAGPITGTTADPTTYNAQGTYKVHWTYNDGNGNSSTQTQKVIVKDTTPPTVSCPAPISASAGSSCQAAIPNIVPNVTASDNCTSAGSIVITQSPAAGTMVGLGPHPITVTATDGANNSSNCSTTFTVSDTTAPVVPNLPGSPQLLNWVSVNTPGSVPSARTGHRMVYDPVRHRVILFGGHDSAVHPTGNYVLTSHLNDVWELNTATNVWTNVTPSSGPMPVGRADFGMAYDVARNKVVIFGGEIDGWLTGDTWEWDPALHTWEEKTAASVPVFGGLFGPAMAYDPNRHQVILFGGRAYYNWGQAGTYAWDGTNWIDVTPAVYPPPRFIHAMATDLARSKVVMFGGKNNEYPLTDTWEWNGSAWTQVTPSGPVPPAREDQSMAYDAARQVTVLFGGYQNSGNDTWSWDGVAWSLEHPQTSPSMRSTAIVYDPSQSKLVLFSGDLQSDTWYSQTTPGLPTITGVGSASVTTPTAMDNCAGPITGTTTDPTTYNAPGTYTVHWTYNDGHGNTSTQTQTVIVNAPTPASISWNNPADITYGTPLTGVQLNATANVPGTFAYTPPLGTTLNAGNGQVLSVTFTPQDQTTYSSTSKQVNINVSKRNATWTTNPNSKAFGANDPAPLTTGSGSNFLASDGVTASYTRVAGEAVSGSPYHISANLSASVAGALNNYNLTNNGANFNIVKASTSTSLISSLNPSVFGQSVTFTATVASSGGTPTGTVQFFDYAQSIGSVSLSAGHALLTTTTLAAGSHSITAVYSGNANFAVSTSSALIQTVSAPTPAGSNVTVQEQAGSTTVQIEFTTVTAGGSTSIVPISPSAAGTMPGGFSLPDENLAFDIKSTATFVGPITVCFKVPSINDPVAFTRLRVLHTLPKLDIAVAGPNNSNFKLLLGNGSGGFSTGGSFGVGPGTGSGGSFGLGTPVQSLAKADFNGDGNLDIAATTTYSNKVSVWLGNGNGGFAPLATNLALGSTPISVAAGDLNSDAPPDLAVANYHSNNISVLLGNGAGGFGAPTNFAVGNGPRAVVMGDFNGDRKLDIAVVNQLSNNVSVLLGTGTGAFSAARFFMVGNAPGAAVVGDFNRDGKLDLAVANFYSNSISFLVGKGDGNFFGAANFPLSTSVFPTSMAIGDFNGDLRPDLAVADAGNGFVAVLLGNSAGSFGSPSYLAMTAGVKSIITADFNNDGKLDLATASTTGLSVRLGLGNGNFGSATAYASGNSLDALVVGNFNADLAVVDQTILSGPDAPNFATRTICARVLSFSPIVIASADDETAPVISNVSASPNVIWPPNHDMIDVTINYDVSDDFTANEEIVSTLEVSSNEPVNMTADGNTDPDIEIVDAHHVRVRAERAGDGNGRAYTITITCKDAAQNTSQTTVTVAVPKSQ